MPSTGLITGYGRINTLSQLFAKNLVKNLVTDGTLSINGS